MYYAELMAYAEKNEISFTTISWNVHFTIHCEIDGQYAKIAYIFLRLISAIARRTGETYTAHKTKTNTQTDTMLQSEQQQSISTIYI